jgi:hypothetical protein
MRKEKRKPYCKPEMERVRLVPEEAVLGGCKVLGAGTGIGVQSNCMNASCIDNGTS